MSSGRHFSPKTPKNMTTNHSQRMTTVDLLKPEAQQQLQQQLSLQSQSNQNLQLVLNSFLNSKRQKRPIPAFLNKLYK
jgi:hypothetical protein